MSSAASKTDLTPEQYEAIEERSEVRHEYYRGEMFAMAGATEAHMLISGNISRELGNRFRGRPCKVFQNDMRVRVRETGLYTYPDVVAVCGPTRFDRENKTTLINPTAIIEILSPSTEVYDRTTKLDHYKAIESLREVALVSQDRARIDILRRIEGRWVLDSITDLGATLRLESLDCDIPVVDIYERVDLPDQPQLRPLFTPDD